MIFKTFPQFLFEGGWATSKTQSTIIRPKIIKDCVQKTKQLESDFNKYLKEIGLPPLDFIKPVGSGTWYEEDIESQPDKVYGDVDFSVSYPVLQDTGKTEREMEIESTKIYNKELLSFLENNKPGFIDVDETRAVSNPNSIKLIMMVETPEGEGWIQVDFIVTHNSYKEWSIFRLTPIRNVKGFVLGNLYSSFGEVLELSIQPRGVRAKIKDGEVIGYSKKTGAEDRLITSDVNRFMNDIAKFIWKNTNPDKPYKESKSLENWQGMDRNNPRFEDMCSGIKAVADTLDQLGEFGTTIKYNGKGQFLEAVKKRYIEKMETAAQSSKFDKAESEAAKAAAYKVKKISAEYIDKAKQLL
jgi:hypothetical protein